MHSKGPSGLRWRVFKAYYVTFVVLSSYLWFRFMTNLRSTMAIKFALEEVNRRNARRIYKAILELQGLYIKVGQLISIMTNFLPGAFREELEGLQDQVPPRPYSAIEERIREEFDGQSPKELFEAFDETPIASASIGQVHVARIRGGEKVAVKVQYPNIGRVVRTDLITLRRIMSIVQRFIPYQGLDNVYREIRAIVLQELDFKGEAENLEGIAANFVDQPNVQFPNVVHQFTTRRVLTTQFMEGVKINVTEELSRMKIDRTKLARLVIEAYCQQIFHHGRYHADPHPGNILVAEGPVITFIDFGAVAEVSEKMRHGMLNFLQGAINRDTSKITAALREMGFIAHRSDPKVYDRVVEYFHARFHEEVKLESFNLKDIKLDPSKGIENLADLRQMDISVRDMTSNFHVPKEWIMLERTILLLMGLCTDLDPNLNPMDVLRPHIEEFVLGKDGDWSKFLLDTARDVGMSALSLPQDVRKFTTRAIQGDLEVSVSGIGKASKLQYELGHQLIFCALTIACFYFSLSLESREMNHAALGSLGLSAIFALLLARSFWRARKWIKKL